MKVIASALMLGSIVGTLGLTCPAGKKAKATPAATDLCTKSMADASFTTDTARVAACSLCCVADALTCGGITGISCGSDKYSMTGTTWSGTATTSSTKNTDCCTAKATCASTYTCPAGMKKKTGVASTKCTGNAASCATGTTCCEKDAAKCGGVPAANMTCGSGKYQTATTDAWKNTAGTAANFATNCCTAKATCASTAYSCPAGMKKKASVDSTKCTSNAASCASTTCCEKDTLKCGGYANADITCATGKFRSC